jgi:hypothetical protein
VSFHQTTGLNISAWKPTIVAGTSYTPRGTLVSNDLHLYVDTYEHEHTSLGGYYAARLTLRLPQDRAEDWLDQGVGRHIEVRSFDQRRVWAGFVNKVTLGLGSLSVERGPLTDIANRVGVIYAEILDATVTPQVVGSRQSTTLVQDTESQERYGIIEKTLSGGTCTSDDAERYRDTYLNENAQPVTSQSLNPGGGDTPTISLECSGYWAWLEAYPYDSAVAGTTTIRTKLLAVLAADANGLFSTNYADIAANAYLTPAQDSDDAYAWTVIKALVALGDVSDNRYSFGVYDDQQVRYRDINSLATRYQHRIGAPGQEIEGFATSERIYPWEARADEWLFLPDFLIGKTQPADRRLDPRFMYLESVKYVAPWGLTLTGARITRLAQVLAKQGLRGGA